MGREGADTSTLGCFYVVIVQAILLFGLEMWVFMPHIRCLLGGFHNRVAQQLLGDLTWRRADGESMRADGIKEINTYVSRRQNTVEQYISTFPIL